jgi:hypothetical protein
MFITATLAEAQKPRMFRATPPAAITQTGITGRVVMYENLQPVAGASIVVSLVREHWQTQEWFADNSTAKRFGPCESGKTVDCIRKNGSYTISAGSLPKSDNEYDSWRNLDVRGEALGHIHYLGNLTRVGLDGSTLTYVPDIYLYKNMEVGQAQAWWVDNEVIAFGFWSKQDWEEEVVIDFILGGTSWTVSQVKYGSVMSFETVGPGEGYGVWIQKEFWAPEGTAGYVGSSACGTIQIRSAYFAEWVKAQLKEVCVPLRPPSGGKG